MEIIGYIALAFGALAVGIAAYLGVREIPSIGRYIRIHRM